jgi:hypothetical protein
METPEEVRRRVRREKQLATKYIKSDERAERARRILASAFLLARSVSL